ncbi:hypothetical protein ACFWNT_09375 [Streptomyces sp. NPDC058409]|uniref:hypothetical protein n=1 Tax=Streptomyces sp. NPDC058409 TaxID=3346484 RepID=UPI00364EF58A
MNAPEVQSAVPATPEPGDPGAAMDTAPVTLLLPSADDTVRDMGCSTSPTPVRRASLRSWRRFCREPHPETLRKIRRYVEHDVPRN